MLRSLLENKFLRLLARVGMGLLFLTTGIDKLLDPYSFVAVVEEYGVVSGDLALAVGIAFPWFETVFGTTLLLGVLPRASSLVICGLTSAFIAAMIAAWGQTLSTGCGCFPWEQHSVTVGWYLVLRDVGVLVVALYTWAFPSRQWALYPDTE